MQKKNLLLGPDELGKELGIVYSMIGTTYNSRSYKARLAAAIKTIPSIK
jgi:hypothetical protein